MRIKGLYIHNNAQSRQVRKEEMAKTTALVLVFFLPHSYDMFVFMCQRGKVRKSPDGG